MSVRDWQEVVCLLAVVLAGVGVAWWAWNGGRWYLGVDYALFCAAYNMRHHGAAVVEIEVKEEARTSWWSKRNGRRSNN